MVVGEEPGYRSRDVRRVTSEKPPKLIRRFNVLVALAACELATRGSCTSTDKHGSSQRHKVLGHNTKRACTLGATVRTTEKIEHVMINVRVDVKGLELIQSLREMEVLRNKVRAMDGDKMCGSHQRVQVDNVHLR
jgi:hypothetical protein